MKLKGSCHCGAVQFSVSSRYPQPFMRCYCSICRKTSGGGGFGTNLGGDASSLEVTGRDKTRIYRALRDVDGKRIHSSHERHFCGECGCHLWAYNPQWPELIHPVASCIDTPLPVPAAHVHIMLGSKAPWVEVEGHADDPRFEEYPDFSLAQWHEQNGVVVESAE